MGRDEAQRVLSRLLAGVVAQGAPVRPAEEWLEGLLARVSGSWESRRIEGGDGTKGTVRAEADAARSLEGPIGQLAQRLAELAAVSRLQADTVEANTRAVMENSLVKAGESKGSAAGGAARTVLGFLGSGLGMVRLIGKLFGGEERPNCSAASRVAPIGLVHALGRFNPEVFTRDVLRACLITHSDPAAINGALAVAYAVRLLVAAEVPPEMLIEDVLHFIDEDAVARRLRLAASLAAHGGQRDHDLANLREIGTSSYVAEAVAAAFYCFAAHPDDFAAAVLTAVNAGGDTDSIAAMTGALAGAYLGAQAIPAELVDGLEGRMYLLVAAPGLFQTAQRRAGLYLRLRRR